MAGQIIIWHTCDNLPPTGKWILIRTPWGYEVCMYSPEQMKKMSGRNQPGFLWAELTKPKIMEA